jgi:hypothetical protein
MVARLQSQSKQYNKEDIWNDSLAPNVDFSKMNYKVQIPGRDEQGNYNYFIVSVDKYGFINIEECSWFGNKDVQSCYLSIGMYLIEWELVEWIKISDEDKELIATKKLCNIFGIEN